MDLNFFLNDIFCQFFNINHNNIIWRKFTNQTKLFEFFFKNISPKAVTKVVKEQIGVARVILFAYDMDVAF
jgi:hypothetical protein